MCLHLIDGKVDAVGIGILGGTPVRPVGDGGGDIVGRVGGGFMIFVTGIGNLGVPTTFGDGGGDIDGSVGETCRLNTGGGAPRPPG